LLSRCCDLMATGKSYATITTLVGFDGNVSRSCRDDPDGDLFFYFFESYSIYHYVACRENYLAIRLFTGMCLIAPT
jgi:hypothetical protein